MPRLDRSRRTNVTIVDIAEQLSISPSTVSRALRNHPDIRPETIEAVKKMAKKLNYQPNTQAQSLRERRTRLIGVILPEIQQYAYGAILNGIEEVAFRKGYQVVVCKSGETYEREMLQASSLSNQVDGVIACLSQQTRRIDHFKQLRQQGMPLVFVERAPERLAAHRILYDNEAGTFQLTEHLIRSGFERVALLTGPEHTGVCQEQLKGFKKAFDRYNQPIADELIVTAGFGYLEGRGGFQKLMKRRPQPDAVVAGSDQIAIAVVGEARRMGVVIPHQLGLAVFGADPFHSRLETTITGLSAKGFEMGSRAAHLCILDIEHTDKNTKSRLERITTEVVVRQSSLRPTDSEGIVSSYSRVLRTGESSGEEVYIY
ncbi:LacI family DNA-binding transcriptional regulator [Larkinella soli]|uniref:LacI family DNA-binding transcriptional regulator n=1 Tax=Larkinella soli TaxID=1770527 RepID=UPI000FFBEE39|nr:LacI family DNA-binding transcriptional regulator [Larkinella soli]